MAVTLYRGENFLITRTLKQSDGSDLPYSALTLAKAVLSQSGIEVADGTFIAGTDSEIRQGDAANEIVLELTGAFTATLAPGVPLDIRWHFEVADSDFSVDDETHRDQQPDAEVINVE